MTQILRDALQNISWPTNVEIMDFVPDPSDCLFCVSSDALDQNMPGPIPCLRELFW